MRVLTTALVMVIGVAVETSCVNGFRNPFSSDGSAQDTLAPIIKAYPREVNLGDTLDLMKNVSAVFHGDSVAVSCDASDLDYTVSGDYEVTYTATAVTGETSEKKVAIRVKNPERKVIYLTFDDGPSSQTEEILRVLRENDVQATFFVTAQYPRYYRYLAEAHEDGNVVAPHTYSHKFSIYESFEDYFKDLEKIQRIIEKYTGERSNVIRFPGGSSNHAFAHFNDDPDFMVKLCDEVQQRGYQYVDWNADSSDASGSNVPVAKLIKRACQLRGNEICMLLHDGPKKATTAAALPAIINFYKSQGYEFGTLTSPAYIFHHTVRPFSFAKKEPKAEKPKEVKKLRHASDSTKKNLKHLKPKQIDADVPVVEPTEKTEEKPAETPAAPAPQPETHEEI